MKRLHRKVWLVGAVWLGCVTASEPAEPVNPVPIVVGYDGDLFVGAPSATITLSGEGFVEGAQGSWNGEARDSELVDQHTLTVSLLAADLVEPGEGTMTVSNPEPGGGTSASVRVTVFYPTPDISDVSPGELVAFSGAREVIVRGQGFFPVSRVLFGGALLQTRYVAGDELIAGSPGATVTIYSSRIRHDIHSVAPDAEVRVDGVTAPSSQPTDGVVEIDLGAGELAAPVRIDLEVVNPRGGGPSAPYGLGVVPQGRLMYADQNVFRLQSILVDGTDSDTLHTPDWILGWDAAPTGRAMAS